MPHPLQPVGAATPKKTTRTTKPMPDEEEATKALPEPPPTTTTTTPAKTPQQHLAAPSTLTKPAALRAGVVGRAPGTHRHAGSNGGAKGDKSSRWGNESVADRKNSCCFNQNWRLLILRTFCRPSLTLACLRGTAF